MHEHLLEVDAHFDLVFCPCLVDGKKADVEALADGEIAISFINGAITTGENEEMAHLLRRKSRVVGAYGACAASGGIPALRNIADTGLIEANYIDSVSIADGNVVRPAESTAVAEGELTLPQLFGRASRLAEVVDVDFSIPGCPPEPAQLWRVMQSIIEGTPLPPHGTVLGAGTSTVCSQCARTKQNKQLSRLYRTWEMVPDSDTCLLDQGLVCLGAATRSGCSALCPAVNVPCSGCYASLDAGDQGARMLSALCSALSPCAVRGCTEHQIAAATDQVLDSVPDPAGTLYRFTGAAVPPRVLR